MLTRQIKMKLVVVSLIVGVGILIAFNAGAGNLEPTAPPGPTMHTLEDIYTAVSGEAQTTAAVDYFLKIDGIEGESTDYKHKDWIELLSFSHGVSMPISGWDTGRTTGTSDHQDFSIVHVLDKASPKLALYCCNGKHIPKVELEMCKGEETSLEYMKVTLSDLIISSVKPSGTIRGSDSLPLEEVSFNYAKIEWDYRLVDGNSIYTGWDVETNTAIDPNGYLNPTP